MSAPRRFISGNTPAEKSMFAQTCNRLSLFLKENGSVGDLSFGINTKFDATGIDRSIIFNTSYNQALTETSVATVDLLSRIDDTGEKVSEKPAAISPPPEYVILDSSREVTNKASSSSSKPKTAAMTIFYGGNVMVVDDVPADRVRDLMLMAKADESKSDEAKDSDLPIARRASLHKFLAKRKDRRASPYNQTQVQSPTSGNEHGFDLNK